MKYNQRPENMAVIGATSQVILLQARYLGALENAIML
jgi:hypothetical protein